MNPYDEFVKTRREAGDSPEMIMEQVAAAAETPVCPFCGLKPATYLCDFVIGFSWDGETHSSGTRIIARDAEMFTCDRPICEDCRKLDGMIHFSGKEPGFQTRDLCPQCRDAIPNELRALVKMEADCERQRMWKRSVGLLTVIEP